MTTLPVALAALVACVSVQAMPLKKASEASGIPVSQLRELSWKRVQSQYNEETGTLTLTAHDGNINKSNFTKGESRTLQVTWESDSDTLKAVAIHKLFGHPEFFTSAKVMDGANVIFELSDRVERSVGEISPSKGREQISYVYGVIGISELEALANAEKRGLSVVFASDEGEISKSARNTGRFKALASAVSES